MSFFLFNKVLLKIMRIHRMSDSDISALNIPIQKYEEDIGFNDFKDKAKTILGEKSLNYTKYLLILYVLIDLYSLTNPERKNGLVKIMERLGLNTTTIQKIDQYLKLGLSTGYIMLLFLNASQKKRDPCKRLN